MNKRTIINNLKKIYQLNNIPWVIGYSGGKDSTAVTQLVWEMLLQIERPKKPVYIISTDTGVENPLIINHIKRSIEFMDNNKGDLPITPKIIKRDDKNSFWVHLIGKGYSYPTISWRWCTDRLKIKPSNNFVKSINPTGQVLLLLGVRLDESNARAESVKKHSLNADENGITLSSTNPNQLEYRPIVDWKTQDVWDYLRYNDNPWGYDNKNVLRLYRDASDVNECPIQMDNKRPSCGGSRFGCWTCTVVNKDKSMLNMISNGCDNLKPLSNLRSYILNCHDRDARRMNGDFIGAGLGFYTKDTRRNILIKLLQTQKEVGMELINLEELEHIRQIWLTKKFEITDDLPKIYKDVTGVDYPIIKTNIDYDIVRESCKNYQGEYIQEMLCRLLQGEEFGSILNKIGYQSEEEALKKC